MKKVTLLEGIAPVRHLVATITFCCMVAVIVTLFCFSVVTAADLIGTVLKGGKPANGVTISLVIDSQSKTNKSPPSPTTTDSAGRYIIREVVPGRYKLSCDSMVNIIDIRYGVNRCDCNL